MSELDATLARLQSHPGVEELILLGSDGLVIQHAGSDGEDAETVAARVPAIAAACESLGTSAHKAPFATAVVEYQHGVAIVISLSSDLLLAVLLRPEIGFAPLLRDLRGERERLTQLL